MIEIKYMFLPLTDEQATNPGLYGGLNQIRKNASSLVENEMLKTLSYGVEKSISIIVYNNVSYTIFKHYCDLDNNQEIFVGKPFKSGGDIVRS